MLTEQHKTISLSDVGSGLIFLHYLHSRFVIMTRGFGFLRNQLIETISKLTLKTGHSCPINPNRYGSKLQVYDSYRLADRKRQFSVRIQSENCT